MAPDKLLAYLALIMAAGLIAWGGHVIWAGLPPPIYDVLLKHYLVTAIYPMWALISFVFVTLAGVAQRDTFEVKFFGLEFKGGGGAAIVWVVATLLGFLIIKYAWEGS